MAFPQERFAALQNRSMGAAPERVEVLFHFSKQDLKQRTGLRPQVVKRAEVLFLVEVLFHPTALGSKTSGTVGASTQVIS